MLGCIETTLIACSQPGQYGSANKLMNESIYKHLVHTYDSIDDTKRRMVGGTSFSTQKHWN